MRSVSTKLPNSMSWRVSRSQLVEDGTVLVACGGRHLQVVKTARGYVAKGVTGAQVNGFCPSVDVLFKSVAVAAGAEAVGVILTQESVWMVLWG